MTTDKTKKFLKALKAIDKLTINGFGVTRKFYTYSFDNEVNLTVDSQGNIQQCTCRACSVTSDFNCSYVLGVRIANILPPKLRIALVKVLIRETNKLKP